MWYYHCPVIGTEYDLPICVMGIGLNDILVEFYRLANNKASEEQGGANRTILSAVNYIDSHYTEEITLECFASQRIAPSNPFSVSLSIAFVSA